LVKLVFNFPSAIETVAMGTVISFPSMMICGEPLGLTRDTAARRPPSAPTNICPLVTVTEEAAETAAGEDGSSAAIATVAKAHVNTRNHDLITKSPGEITQMPHCNY
jgi:hypothetical protein